MKKKFWHWLYIIFNYVVLFHVQAVASQLTQVQCWWRKCVCVQVLCWWLAASAFWVWQWLWAFSFLISATEISSKCKRMFIISYMQVYRANHNYLLHLHNNQFPLLFWAFCSHKKKTELKLCFYLWYLFSGNMLENYGWTQAFWFIYIVSHLSKTSFNEQKSFIFYTQ